jgi:hypothetical protein
MSFGFGVMSSMGAYGKSEFLFFGGAAEMCKVCFIFWLARLHITLQLCFIGSGMLLPWHC